MSRFEAMLEFIEKLVGSKEGGSYDMILSGHDCELSNYDEHPIFGYFFITYQPLYTIIY